MSHVLRCYLVYRGRDLMIRYLFLNTNVCIFIDAISLQSRLSVARVYPEGWRIIAHISETRKEIYDKIYSSRDKL